MPLEIIVCIALVLLYCYIVIVMLNVFGILGRQGQHREQLKAVVRFVLMLLAVRSNLNIGQKYEHLWE